VSLILEGTVRRSDDRIRIVAQLIKAREDKHIWAETYDRELKDIFIIQSDVAEKIADVLSVELSANEKLLIQKKPTEDFAAYNFYLKGREYYYRYIKKDNEQAIRMFKKALEIDPNYALALAGLGDAYSQRYHRFGFSSAWIDSAIKVSREAIDIDPNSAEAHKALGTAYSVIDRTGSALVEYKKSINLNPGYFPAVGNLAYRYKEIGQLEEAIKWNKRQIEINPAFDGCYNQIGLTYLLLCEDLKALHAFEKAHKLNPYYLYARWGLINLHLVQSKYDEASTIAYKILDFTKDSLNAYTYAGYIEHVQNNLSKAIHFFLKAVNKSQEKFFHNYHIISTVHLAVILWKQGEKQKAENLFFEFLNYAKKEIDSGNESWEICYNLAGVLSWTHDYDKAIKWLDLAIDKGWRDYRIGKIEPIFENLRQDNRFKQRIMRVKRLVDEARERIRIAEIE
jgi:tetratricopeptide (TPR) repeat protein